MIRIEEVKSRAQRKAFVELPLRMYKGNEFFVPPLYGDEMKMFTDKNVYFRTCQSAFFLAYKDDKLVGRIQGIIQKQYNELHSQRRVRFSRFDSIDDQDVANALFDAVASWAKALGMDTLCGPLGYSDLEREGLLIEGFDQLSTFEEQYNFDYYGRLCDGYGLKKEVDWLEYRLFSPEKRNPMVAKLAKKSLDLERLHLAGPEKSRKAFINKYREGIFRCLDECYKNLYGVVPFTREMEDQMVSQFLLLVDQRYVIVVLDESEKVVAFGLGFPAIGQAVQKSGGRLTLPTIIKILKTVKKPRSLDLGLIAVLPEYQAKAVNAVMMEGLLDMLEKVEYCETNLNLEDNYQVQAQWKHFNAVRHKRRRSYVKTL